MVRASGAREKVENSAIELFAAKGVDGVSIGEIASLAGVSQGALYRHYVSKEELAWSLFSTAYLRTGAELDDIRRRNPDFPTRVTAMVGHFGALYDSDPALFRFMLIVQHDLLPRIGTLHRTPVDALADTVAAAVDAGEVAAVDPAAAAAVIMGVVLQTAVFHIYGRLHGSLAASSPRLANAALAAVAALGRPMPSSSDAI
ncbi:MAG TPA: TetR/AcrR family transcriptional regulator [Stellaceae bacterium]|jgi:AcrR family transcriptional regulator|nr:TetR/AcrR family transcriptional regulator [Stellaceae bacterium]